MRLTTFHDVNHAYISDSADQLDLDWIDVVDLVTSHFPVKEKAECPLFNLTEFRAIGAPDALLGQKQIYKNGQPSGEYETIPNTVRRCKENVLSISGIILDMDAHMHIEEAMDLYCDLEFVLYTTFNHTAERHKFRIILPFTQPLLGPDIPKKLPSIKETFANTDRASFNLSQGFYLHSGQFPRIEYNTGLMLDPYTAFKNHDVQPYIPFSDEPTAAVSADYKQRVLNSLQTCRDVKYPVSIIFATICKSSGIDYAEFCGLVNQVSTLNSDLRKPENMRTVYKAAGNRVKRDTRDRFIKEHGGRPIISKQLEEQYNYLKAEQELKILKQELIRRKKLKGETDGNN